MPQTRVLAIGPWILLLRLGKVLLVRLLEKLPTQWRWCRFGVLDAQAIPE